MRAFIEEVGNILDIARTDLIEKDIIIHNILQTLSGNEFFRSNFLFKGGTCLIKVYLGYFRFSEDIDFTWHDQSVFESMSRKEIRRYLSGLIDEVGDILEEIGKGQGLDFKCDQSDRRYVELGGGNKTATFKLWYGSEILKHPAFVKVQINFIDTLRFSPVKKELKSLLSDRRNESLEGFFQDEYGEYSRIIDFPTYDLREILCEKIRAILTRRGTKARDFIDVFLISGGDMKYLSGFKPDLIEKTKFILGMYEKYRANFRMKKGLISSREIFKWGHERELLLFELEETEFVKFIEYFMDFLNELVEGLNGI